MMATGINSMMTLLVLLGGSGINGDLLDYTPTGAYWEMRDQRIVDLDTMSAVLADEDATAVDKLMAIRAVGEWGMAQEAAPAAQADPADKAKSLKLLAPFVGSKEPFVDRYAKRSIAWVKGQEPEAYAPLPAEVYDLDLAMLSEDMTVVGQMKMANGIGPVDLAAMIPDIKMEGESMREQMMSQMTPGLVQVTQMIGNARIDLVTMGVALNREEEIAFTAVIRGQYDRVSVLVALEDAIGEDEAASFYSVGEIEVVAVEKREPFAMLMPSDELLVIVFSPREVKLPIDEIANKLQQPDRKPALNDVLMKQVAAVDREKADVWAAMQVTPMMKNVRELREVFGAFDAARAMATRDTEGLLDIQWVGEGQDEAAVKEVTVFLTKQIKEGVANLIDAKQHMPEAMRAMMDPLIEMAESMTFKQDGKTMTGGMKIDQSVGISMPMLMFSSMRVHRQHGHGQATEEDLAVEVGGG